MTAIYDIIETLIGSPGDVYQVTILYLVAAVLFFVLIFGLFDILYAMAIGWWKG